MTDKITLTDLVNLQNETTAVNAINTNNTALTTALDNTLSRNGTSPNMMGASLDMNSNHILNLPAPNTTNEPVRLQDLNTLIAGVTSVGTVPTGGTTGQALVKTSGVNYATIWSNVNSPGGNIFYATNYGVVADGVTNDATALQACLTAASANGGCVILPAGIIRSNSALTATIPSGKGLNILGVGAGVTVLYFPASNGLTVTYTDLYSAFSCSGMDFTTGSANLYFGLTLSLGTAVANPAVTAPTYLENLSFHGSDGYGLINFWNIGIRVINVSNINFNSINITGSINNAIGNGISLVGKPASSTYGVAYNVESSTFNSLGIGVSYGDFIQGVTINQCNFTGGVTAVLVVSAGSGLPVQLAVTNSQLGGLTSNYINLARVAGVGQFMCTGNVFIQQTNTNGILGYPVGFSIIGNTFQGGGYTGTAGIVIFGGNGVISGNQFASIITGINLAAASSNVNVQSNNYNSVTTSTVNNGTSNVLGGGSV